ncbi:MAG: four-carbon acid sugar kinase family protein [Oscillospiraceae bacterium]|nr:four-carbon acid sugar kinase family protein [Oscillospiraceae bacterium]
MDRLLIIADDFTGALDTGVQFAKNGARVLVSLNWNCDLSSPYSDAQVLVLDAETRHLPYEVAGSRIRTIATAAAAAGIRRIMKKTDSALRGNVGAELTALLESSGQKVLHFLPAFPEMGRTTENGIHYVGGIPVNKSVFGRDPFEPVRRSDIAGIIHEQSEINVRIISEKDTAEDEDEPVIAVYDAGTDEDIERCVDGLAEKDELYLMAGCAGLAKAVSRRLFDGSEEKTSVNTPGELLVICGSVNPVTVRQLDFAEKNGFRRIRLSPEQKIDGGYFRGEEGRAKISEWTELCLEDGSIIIDSNDMPGSASTLDTAVSRGLSKEELIENITGNLGCITRELLDRGVEKTLFITGGDTLLGFMREISADILHPLGEIAPGTVISELEYKGETYMVITKSGGFGQEDLLLNIRNIGTQD